MYNCFTLHLIVLTVPKRNSANVLDVLNELCDVTYCNSVQRNFETEIGLLDYGRSRPITDSAHD